MRIAFVAALCIAALGLVAGNASASALSYLVTDGRINGLQDLDYEALFDSDRSGTVTSGDFLFGVFEVESMTYTPAFPPPTIAGDDFTAVFVVKLGSVTGPDGGGDYSYVMAAPTAAEFTAITGIAPSAAAGTIGIVFSDSTQDFGSRWIDPTLGFAASMLSATGTRLWEVGFTGAGGTTATDEFWFARQEDGNIIDKDADVSYAAALNNTWVYAAAAGYPLHPHQHLTLENTFAFTGPTQWQLAGERGQHDPGNWALATDTDLFISPTPEPGSLALLGLGLTAACGVLYRRRRQRA